MAEIRFYHLTASPLERALPKLVEKVLERGDRTVIMAGSEERVEALNAALWTYDPQSFLPHGSVRDGNAPDQPVWLTTAYENPNRASVLFLTDGATCPTQTEFPLVIEVFDGGVAENVEAARTRWKSYRDAGHTLTYWRQTDRGAWEKNG